jgi:hypothetical protein
MTMPFGLLGDPQVSVPYPYARKPSIVDRVAARLFPTDQYGGLLDPETQAGLSRQGLLSLGMGLLRGSGVSGNQGTLANIGSAYQGVNFPEMAQQALQIQQYRQQVADQQKIAGVAANHPAKPGETPDETYARIAGMVSDLAGQPGTEDLIGKLSNVLAQLRPRAAARQRLIPRIVKDEHGVPHIGFYDPETGAHISTSQEQAYVPPVSPNVTLGAVQEREKASAALAAQDANTIINRLEDADPNIAARVAQKAAAHRSLLAALARRVAGISDEEASYQIESQIEQSMTPQELEYYTAAKQYLGGILPGLSGKTVTAREFMMQAPAFFSMGGASPSVSANRRAARERRIRSFVAEAGRAGARVTQTPPPADEENYDDYLRPEP